MVKLRKSPVETEKKKAWHCLWECLCTGIPHHDCSLLTHSLKEKYIFCKNCIYVNLYLYNTHSYIYAYTLYYRLGYGQETCNKAKHANFNRAIASNIKTYWGNACVSVDEVKTCMQHVLMSTDVRLKQQQWLLVEVNCNSKQDCTPPSP